MENFNKTPIAKFTGLDESDWENKYRKQDDPLNTNMDGSGSKEK